MAARHRLSRRTRLRLFWRRVLERQWWPPAANQVALVFAAVFAVSAGAMTMKVVPEPTLATEPALAYVVPAPMPVVPAALPVIATPPMVTVAVPPHPIRRYYIAAVPVPISVPPPVPPTSKHRSRHRHNDSGSNS